MPKTQMYVICDNAYLGKSRHWIARVTKKLLVTEPIAGGGGALRFYRPSLESLTDGMSLVPYPKSSRSSAVSYTLKIVKDKED
mgnify:CR=1 FL=1